MDIIVQNIIWMSFNLALAWLGVVFGWIMYLTKSRILRVFSFILWIIFAPNTIYILTDVIHIQNQISRVATPFVTIVLVQFFFFLILGLLSFVVALEPFEKLLKKTKITLTTLQVQGIIFIFNCLFALGVVLGRFQRVNSWEIFTDIGSVFSHILIIIFTPELILSVLLFAVLGNIVYFALKKPFVKVAEAIINKLDA